MAEVFGVFTLNDIVFAFAAAFTLTYLIKRIAGGYRIRGVYDNIMVGYDRKNLKSVLIGCYELFPRETITFHGDTFKRGNHVQILTIGSRKITGELVGANNDGMICLLTAKHIVARELSQVLEISRVDATENTIE